MNSKQRRKSEKQSWRIIKTIGKLITSDVKKWKEDPNITKEDIIKQLEQVSEGIEQLTNIKNLNSNNSQY